MTQVRHARRADPLQVIRTSCGALCLLGIAGTAFELASLQHWNGAMQLVPWFALVVLAAALVLHLGAPDRTTRNGLVRVLAVLVLLISVFGVVEHALVNYQAGPLDQRFAESWGVLPDWLRWWYAITRAVGPAPTLAPGMLGQAALTLMLATIGRSQSWPACADQPVKRHRRYTSSSHLPPVAGVRPDLLVSPAPAPTRHRRPGW